MGDEQGRGESTSRDPLSCDLDLSRPVAWQTWAVAAFVAVGLVTLITLFVLPASVLEPVGRIEAGEAALAVGFGVLVLDAVAPIPSSAVMIALGTFAGLGAATVVSTMGLLVAALVGYAMGHAGARLSPWRSERAPRWATGSTRRAVAAVIASRSIPLIAETTAITAGAVGMRLAAFVPSAAVGALAPAFVYAAIGSGLTTAPGAWLISGVTIALVVVAIAAHRLVGAATS